jgi:MFS transporter, DHA1 family, staphyloferrin B biosynthesis exporter
VSRIDPQAEAQLEAQVETALEKAAGSALRWLFLIQLAAMGALEMSGPFWPLHLRTLGAQTPAALAWTSGLVYAGPMLAAMLTTPLWGRLADRTGHKPMLLRALVALALTQLWVAFADSLTSVILARLTQGALAGFIAAAQAYGATTVQPARRGALMARLQVATALGSLAGPLAGGVLFDTVGFRALNLSAAALCALCALATLLKLPAVRSQMAMASEPAPEPAPVPASASAFASAQAARAAPAPAIPGVALGGLLLSIVLVQAGKMAPSVFFGVYAEQVLHAPGWLSGLCYGAPALGLCIAAPWWARRFEARSSVRVLADIGFVSWACAALLALAASNHTLGVFIATRVAWGVCLGALLPVFYTLLSRQAPGAEQGRVLGLGNSAAKAGGLIGLAAGSAALAWLPAAYLFWPVAALYAIAALGINLLRRRTIHRPLNLSAMSVAPAATQQPAFSPSSHPAKSQP